MTKHSLSFTCETLDSNQFWVKHILQWDSGPHFSFLGSYHTLTPKKQILLKTPPSEPIVLSLIINACLLSATLWLRKLPNGRNRFLTYAFLVPGTSSEQMTSVLKSIVGRRDRSRDGEGTLWQGAQAHSYLENVWPRFHSLTQPPAG